MNKEMKSASVVSVGPDAKVSVNEAIKVQHGLDRAWQGSCNACTTRDYDTVTNVDLRGVSFRLCDPCRKILKAAL